MEHFLTKVESVDIDEILNEIGNQQREETKSQTEPRGTNEQTTKSNTDWNQILHEIGDINVPYIKNLITSNEITINSHHPLTGKTLLIYAVIIGNGELVKVICNFGADVHIKDNDGKDALDYAKIYGRYWFYVITKNLFGVRQLLISPIRLALRARKYQISEKSKHRISHKSDHEYRS